MGNYDDVIDPIGMNNGKVIFWQPSTKMLVKYFERTFSCFEVYGISWLWVDVMFIILLSCSGQLVCYLFCLSTRIHILSDKNRDFLASYERRHLWKYCNVFPLHDSLTVLCNWKHKKCQVCLCESKARVIFTVTFMFCVGALWSGRRYCQNILTIF